MVERESKVKTKANTKKKLLIAAGVVVVALAAALVFISNYLVNYAIGRSGNGGDREVALEVDAPADSVEAVMEDNRAAYKSKIDTFTKEHPGRDVTLTADDGLTLHGVYYANAETADTHHWALVLHGYRGDYTGALQLAAPYYEAGYQVIAPDLRACGESEGDYVGMGWLDRKDILRWIDFILADDPQAKIVIHGISMGAATTMMTAGESTPDNVKAFVEDCGYTSVWDIFSSELQLRFGLPEFPILYTASGVARLRAGYSFTEASALAQVAHCEKPMLFIHGTADDFIPYEMMDTLYNAKPGDNKAELTAEGAGHGEAMYALGDSYIQSAENAKTLVLLRLIWRNASDSIGKSGTAKAVPLLCCLGRIRRTMQQGRGENAVYRYRVFPVGNREGAAAKP